MRLHIEIDLALSYLARKFAGERDPALLEVLPEDWKRAARHIVDTIPIKKGAPPATQLRRHVEGMMALIQEFSGLPVVVSRVRNGKYDPHFGQGVSRIIPDFFRTIDPVLSEAKLARMVLDARKRLKGKRARFSSYYPCYNSTIHPH